MLAGARGVGHLLKSTPRLVGSESSRRALCVGTTAAASHGLRMLIMGPPGGGKGTISNWIKADYKTNHVSSGDILRSHIEQGTELGTKAADFIRNGALVPDDVMVGLIDAELDRLGGKSWLLDGFPRNDTQAQSLASKGHHPDVVLLLDIPDEVIIERIKHRWVHVSSGRVYHTLYNPPQKEGIDDETGEPLIQRPDDTVEAVTKRLESYHKMTDPLAEFFKNNLRTFKGSESKKIYPEIQKVLSTMI